jgi:geranylgeranyl diphosphate synthase type II
MISTQQALAIIQQEIAQIRYPESPRRLYEPIAYILALKGKKIRPMLTLLACNLYKEDVKESLNMALAWEIFHNFTLMHDDVMDQADVRRGQPTVHKKWNENTAILSGDSMLILAYQYLTKSSEVCLKKLLDLFSTTAAEICDGQEFDVQFEQRLDVTEEEYLNMIRLKTAVMIGSCLKSGAIIGGACEKDQNLLYDFGINLGIAFQIQDDLLDVYGDPAVFGKNIGGDILCGKKTYLFVNALNTTDEKIKQELINWLNVKDKNSEKIAAITSLYNQQGIKEKARAKMEDFYQKAIAALNNVNIPTEKKAVLLHLAEELMDRKS